MPTTSFSPGDAGDIKHLLDTTRTGAQIRAV
jgi:hypothetical protein